MAAATAMKCSICKIGTDTKICADCGKPVCSTCRADFPHHDPPHVRCETCYFYKRGAPRRNGRDYSSDADW